MTPRPYQVDCLNAIKEARDAGITRQLCVLSTGCGKAMLAASIPTTLALPSNKRMMVLVHRDELAYQMAEKLHRCNPSLKIGIEKAEYRAGDADLVVASVQTIGRTKDDAYSPRLQAFNPDPFLVVQADEVHHLSIHAKQWLAVLKYMRVLKNDPGEDRSKSLLGWTATPSRSDNLGLEAFFDKIVFNYGIKEAIADKWLTDIVCPQVETEVDISQVRTTAGDFNIGQLSNVVNTPERNELVALKYKELCPGLPALFFTVDIQHSHDIADTMQRHGWRVYPISGNTPDGERKRLMALMRSGDIHGLSSCGVLNEGVDIPNAEAGFMLRPTKSGLLYRQMVGRILRPSPAPEELAAMRANGLSPRRVKPHAIIVDFCDVTGRHPLITLPTLFGLRADFKAEKKITEVVEEIEQLELENPGVDIRREANMDAIRSSIRYVDLLRPPTTPPEIRKYSKFNWLQEAPGAYRLGVLDGSMLSIRENQLGHYEVGKHTKGIKSFLGQLRSLSEAIEFAEKEIPYADRLVLNATAGWRKEPPSEKQVGLLYYLDKNLKSQFGSKEKLFEFCMGRYKSGSHDFSRGSISQKIDSLRSAR